MALNRHKTYVALIDSYNSLITRESSQNPKGMMKFLLKRSLNLWLESGISLCVDITLIDSEYSDIGMNDHLMHQYPYGWIHTRYYSRGKRSSAAITITSLSSYLKSLQKIINDENGNPSIPQTQTIIRGTVGKV